MELRHIPLDRLSVSPLNMRFGTVPDVADILPTIRMRGILQPLLVRPNGSPDRFEVVAGARRLTAAGLIAADLGEIAPLPCAVMDEGDDAAALEASLIENTARLDPDAMRQYETFVRLVAGGRTVEQVAETFGITARMVSQRLALGNLIEPVRDLYRGGGIDAETVRHLTLATEKQQKAWIKLFKAGNAPVGRWLKNWLFGGTIPTGNAIFPLADYRGRLVGDLFSEDSYFADVPAFWELQNAAIAAKRAALLADGWAEVEILEPGAGFHAWNHEPCPKSEGGAVFIAVSHQGEVACHEGWIGRDEAKRRESAKARAAGGKAEPVARAEVTHAQANYIDLHRHALARVALLEAAPGMLLRLAVAQIVAGSALWSVRPDEQASRSEATAKSLEAAPAEIAFRETRKALLTLLGLPDYHRNLVRRHGDAGDAVEVFAALLTVPDAQIWPLFAFVLAESLESGSPLVDAVGIHLSVDPTGRWNPDDAFFDLMRDREAANRIVAELAGKKVADANAAERLKVQKIIVRDCLDGTNGRTKVEGWVPRWLRFPAQPYTKRGGVPAVTASARAAKALAAHRAA